MSFGAALPVSLRHAACALPGIDVPGGSLSNAELARLMRKASEVAVEFHGAVPLPISSPEFPEHRLGILERRVLGEECSVRDMARVAAGYAIDRNRIDRERVRVVIVTSVTKDRVVPALAVSLQADLGLDRSVVAFDLVLGCSGFLAALDAASRMLTTCAVGDVALVVSAEAMHRVLDATDRTTCSVFGDGAGCVVLERTDVPRMLPVSWHSDGQHEARIAIQPDDDSVHPTLRFAHVGGEFVVREDRGCSRRVTMEGRRVFRDMVRLLPELVSEFMARHRIARETIDHFVFHQANQRMIEAATAAIGVDPDRVPTHIARLGNTTSASIPILLAELSRDRRIVAGDRVLLIGFGTGYSVGITALEWSAT